MNRFNIGQLVKRTSLRFSWADRNPIVKVIGFTGSLIRVECVETGQEIGNGNGWGASNFSALELTYKDLIAGDKLTLRRDLTIGELMDTYAFGYDVSTPKFFVDCKVFGRKTEFEVLKTNVNRSKGEFKSIGTVKLTNSSWLPLELFEIVPRPVIEVKAKEMTVAAISKVLGYEVKVVK